MAKMARYGLSDSFSPQGPYLNVLPAHVLATTEDIAFLTLDRAAVISLTFEMSAAKQSNRQYQRVQPLRHAVCSPQPSEEEQHEV